jgi:serine/threonine protein phosphatase PrpC
MSTEASTVKFRSSNSSHLHSYQSKSNFQLAVVQGIQNNRRHYEDAYKILPILDKELSNYSYFAVFDGHQNNMMADFLEEHFENYLIGQLKNHHNTREDQIRR